MEQKPRERPPVMPKTLIAAKEDLLSRWLQATPDQMIGLVLEWMRLKERMEEAEQSSSKQNQ